MTLAVSALRASGKLNIGIGTYSDHNLSVDDMIVQLNALRIQEIEMSRGEFMLFSKPDASLFRSTADKLDRAGIRCVSYYSLPSRTSPTSRGQCTSQNCWVPVILRATRQAASLPRSTGVARRKGSPSEFIITISKERDSPTKVRRTLGMRSQVCPRPSVPPPMWIRPLRIRSCGRPAQAGATTEIGASQRHSGPGMAK